MMLEKMASGYDTSRLFFSDELGNILTCAGNSVTTINAGPQEHAMSGSASVCIENNFPLLNPDQILIQKDLKEKFLAMQALCKAQHLRHLFPKYVLTFTFIKSDFEINECQNHGPLSCYFVGTS